MIHPSYKEMISKINEGLDMDEAPLVTSRYSIVIAAAKRARQLIAGDEPMVINKDNEKALSTAIKEIYEDQVHILREDAAAKEAELTEEDEQAAVTDQAAEDITGEADGAEMAEAAAASESDENGADV
ncbi:MAG: DNA-directed RNA polymerase subunit omega [Eubacterium sp.]|nr:DNA-directed RNA polymerase subunit omega [Eubacterium sp.]